MKRLNLLPRKRYAFWSRWSMLEVSDRTQNAFLGCAAAIVLVSIVNLLETQRIVQAEVDNQRAHAHLVDVERRESNVRTVAQALTSLGTVARNVEQVRQLSHRRLATFVRVGDVLPRGIWITEITSSQQHISLKGRALNAGLIGDVLRNLANDHTFTQPQLVNAREHNGANSHFIDFEVTFSAGEKS